MLKEYMLTILLCFIVLTSAFSLAQEPSFTITLVEKSNGLEIPTKESGKTEYEVADINHDGFLDIISVGDHGSPNINSDQFGIMVWLGNGGYYWDVQQYGDFGYGGCAIGDLNLDGINDIVWGVHHNYTSDPLGDTILEAGLGDGTASNWTSWGEGLATNGEDWGMFATDLADFDVDGDLDIVSESFGCCNGIQIYENLGNGTWQHAWGYNGGNVQYTIETGDFNADGYPDFICTHWDVNVYFGLGNLSFENKDLNLPVGSINAIDVGDINHDGQDDIVLALDDNLGVQCYQFNNQTNSWVSYSTGLPSSEDYDLIQCGDINFDQHQDIIAYKDNTGSIYLGNGNGIWTNDGGWTMPSPGDYSAMRVDGDVDFDGREDIIIQAEEGSWPSGVNTLKLFSPWENPVSLSAYVKKPWGGETYYSGTTSFIKWLSSIPTIQTNSTASLYLSTQGNSGPWSPIIENMPNSGTYQWIVPAVSSTMCRIKLTITTDSSTFSTTSSNDFTIINQNNTLIANAHGPYNAEPNQMIAFTGSATGGQAPYSWYWDFGDGTYSIQQNPYHSYSSNNTFQVNLSVTDSQNNTNTNTTYAYIQDIIQPPQAHFTFDPFYYQYVNEPIQFTDLSIDNDGYIVNWTWDFGDGNISYEQNPIHTYTVSGLYEVYLNVTDNEGYSNESSNLIYPTYPVEEIDVEQTIQDRGFPIRHAADGDWSGAQNFTPTVSNISKCEVYLRKFGTPEFNLTFDLREDAIDGPILDTLVFIPDEIPTSWTWIELDFIDINVTSGMDYFIKSPPAPSGVTTSFGYEWGYAFGNQYDDGAFWFTRDGGNLWRDLPTMYEFTFRTYGFMPIVK